MSHQADNNTLVNKQMPLTRRRILTLLKERGKLTADELAQLLEISSVAVRRHLMKLERDELVTYEEIQRGMGRPSYVYRLGPAAANFFPRGYEDLAMTVLTTIQDLYGIEAVDAIFRVRSQHLVQNYRTKINGKTLGERIEQVSQMRQTEGYMSTWQEEADGSYTFAEANCPIIHVAQGCESACKQDVYILSELLEADIVRKTHMRQGDNACSYQIRPKSVANNGVQLNP